MEKQRSFSLKPTKFLVFSLTISSSLIFVSFLFGWVIKATPSFHPETHLQFNHTPLNSPLESLTVQTFTGFNRNPSASEVKDSAVPDANFWRVKNVSEIARGSISDRIPGKESETEMTAADVKLGDTPDGNGTFVKLNHSAIAANYSILINAHPRKPGIASVVAGDSVSETIQVKGNRPLDLRAEVHDANTSASGYSVSGQHEFSQSNTTYDKINIPIANRIEEKSKKSCDITQGKWVFDESYPLYRHTTCPIIDEGFNCEANGRLDKEYMKWRWQPQDCDIPRFNATEMLELIRGKRLVFVGDSLNRNQWESMLCLLMGAVKDPKKVYETHGRRITKEKGDYSFKFVGLALQDYKCTVEYYVTHFLVHESKGRIGKKRVQTLRIDTMDRGSSRWRGADILIFNTAHWWSHHKTKAGINYYQEGSQIHSRLDVSVAFRKALVTWASWVDKYINPRKTQVFFRSYAPSHFSGGQWDSGGHCSEASRPLNATPDVGSEKNIIVGEVLRQIKTPVTFLNITGLSNYRIDGHPSVYGRKSGNGYQDCSHWCLPGVPDSWNELLYFHLKVGGRNRANAIAGVNSSS